jgi:hypothetical protein
VSGTFSLWEVYVSEKRFLTPFLFSEPWKGSSDPLDPEKHWGLFTVDRRPKLAMQEIPHYAEIN